MRKIIERVFGILKKRFRILKLPLCVNDLAGVEHVIRSCCILHNMIMQDKGHHTRGLLQTDWVDTGPDASKARRELYDVSNGRVFCFNGVAYVTTDDSNFMLTGSQCDHPNFCRVDQQVVSTQSDANFEEVREVLTEHLRVVTSPQYKGPDTARWPKPAAVCRPQERGR